MAGPLFIRAAMSCQSGWTKMRMSSATSCFRREQALVGQPPPAELRNLIEALAEADEERDYQRACVNPEGFQGRC
jgi:hypothetical protein